MNKNTQTIQNHSFRLALITTAFCLLLLVNIKTAGSSVYDTELKMIIDKERFLDPEYLYFDLEINSFPDAFKTLFISLETEGYNLEIEEITVYSEHCGLFAGTYIKNASSSADIYCFNENTNASSTTLVASVKSKKINPGWAKISLDNSMVMSNEEKPKNILKETESYYLFLR